jgi:hypothetical protein
MRNIGPEEIEQFIMEHCPQEHWRHSENVRPWINYMMGKGCIEAFTEDGRKISVVLCSRLTNTENVDQDFHIDPDGDCIAIDLLLSTGDNILKSIACHLIRKYGVPKNVHWKRGTQQTTALAQRLQKLLLPN